MIQSRHLTKRAVTPPILRTPSPNATAKSRLGFTVHRSHSEREIHEHFLYNEQCPRPPQRQYPQRGRWGLPSAHALGLGDVRWKLTRPICGIFEHFSLDVRHRSCREHDGARRQDRLASSLYCSQAESTPTHLPVTQTVRRYPMIVAPICFPKKGGISP